MRSFTALDVIVLIAYLAGTTALGIFLGRHQKDAKDYFVAGHRIPWWAVLFSVVATETSALTIISIPSVAYLGNLGYLQIVVGYIIGRIVIAFTLLPRYYNGNLVTAYALLERRFGVATRRVASVIFMFTRAFADSVRVFATAIPIALILGPVIPAEYLKPAAILTLGVLTLIYTYHGGVRAVVWTDVVQTGIYLLGGITAVVIIGHHVPGGWPAIFHTGAAAGKFSAIDLSFNLSNPYTLWAGVIGGAFLSMASHGADQVIVQRLLAASSLKDAQRAIIGSGFVVFAQFALFLTIGVGAWVYFGAKPFDPTDAMFPTFIITAMPAGLVGLLIAAILAATMSAHSGAINSLAAATVHDIYLPLTGNDPDSPRTLRVAKLASLAWGVFLLVAALLYPEQKTPVVIVALAIASSTYGALLGSFGLGLFWHRAGQRAAIAGMIVGIIVMSVVVFANQFAEIWPAVKPLGNIAWPWYVLIGTAVTFITGMITSFIPGETHTKASFPNE